MAKTTSPELKRFLRIGRRLQERIRVPDEDLNFYISFLPQINQEKIEEANKLIQSGELTKDGLIPGLTAEHYTAMAQAQLQAPEYRERLIRQAEADDTMRKSQSYNEGLNLILGGLDIAQSVKQIKTGEALARRSKRPRKPLVPQRDEYLANALRQTELGTMDSERAIAPVRAEIQDQFLSDMANAKTASGGQLGSYGAYAQLAADRRNRAAMQLAPIQDEIRRAEQARYDALLNSRMQESQQMFRNQAALYPYELQQYNSDQDVAGSLAATGRENLRNSLYNAVPQVASFAAQRNSRRRYDKLKNNMSMYGDDVANWAADSRADLEKNYAKNYYGLTVDDSPEMWDQMYID